MNERTDYFREYRKKNRERLNEQSRKKYRLSEDHRLKRKGINQRYYLAHREELKQRNAEKATEKVQESIKQTGGIEL